MAMSINPKFLFPPAVLAVLALTFGSVYNGNAANAGPVVVKHQAVAAAARPTRSELERTLLHQAAAIVDENKDHAIQQPEWNNVYAFAGLYVPTFDPTGRFAYDPKKLSEGLSPAILQDFVNTYGAKLPAEKTK